MAERFKPRTGDMVYAAGMDPDWYAASRKLGFPGFEPGDNPNGEVIEVNWKGAYVEFFKHEHGCPVQKFYEKNFFEDKVYPPDQGGFGFWRLGE